MPFDDDNDLDEDEEEDEVEGEPVDDDDDSENFLDDEDDESPKAPRRSRKKKPRAPQTTKQPYRKPMPVMKGSSRFHPPILPAKLTQGFGERPEVYRKFGQIGHNGLDFRTKQSDSPSGQRPVYAVWSGVVAEVKDQGKGGYGRYIRIKHPQLGETVYAHLAQAFVRSGQSVSRGQQIGKSDNTGFSSAAHLHFGFRPLAANIKNGYAGYTDPTKYF